MKDNGTLILEKVLDDLNNMSDEEIRKMLEKHDKIIKKENDIFESDRQEIDFELDIDETNAVKDNGTLILEKVLDDLSNMSNEEIRKMLEERDKIIKKENKIFESDREEIDFELDIDETDRVIGHNKEWRMKNAK